MYRVLIVDDEALIRKRVRFGIDWAACGMEVAGEAARATEAMRFIEQYQPDVAIVDIAMPGISGLELAADIRNRGYAVKIILLTGQVALSMPGRRCETAYLPISSSRFTKRRWRRPCKISKHYWIRRLRQERR